MSKALPIEIKRQFSITNNKDHWILKCDSCGTKFQLKKPAKGKDIHGGNLLALLDHAASHPLPQEEEEELVVVPATPPPAPPRPKLATIRPISNGVKKPAPVEDNVVELPTSKVEMKKDTTPTVRHPNAYKVEWYGTPSMCHMVKVSHFSDPAFDMFRHVQQMSEHHYSVVVQAANAKHGRLIGERLINKFFREQL
jgi:hypothetical protein